MKNTIIAAGAFFGLTAVILGAFGAHALKNVLDASRLASFETGVRYQMYHGFLLLIVGFSGGISPKFERAVFWLATVGTILFSGSIYLLSGAVVSGVNAKVIGPITPVGGLLLIVAWFLLFIDFIRKKS